MGPVVIESGRSQPSARPALRLAWVSPGAPGQGPPGEGSDPADLVERASQGNQVAWAGLVGLYAHRVFGLVKARVRDAELAEEITQSVFATVARQLGSEEGYRESGRFEAWLFRVALNRVRDEARRRKRRAALQERLATEPAFTGAGEDASDTPEFGEAELTSLRAALGKLGERDREIIELRHHAQMSFKEIASVLGEPMGTLLARHHRALKKIRELIEASAGAGEAARQA